MGKLIMIVDDSASLRQVVGIALKGAGYDVIEACDGKDALSKLTGQKVHLIVSDVNMPNMDGFEFVRTARGQDFGAPIIMVTTEGSEDRVRDALESGVQGYVVKPFTADDLKEALAGVGL